MTEYQSKARLVKHLRGKGALIYPLIASDHSPAGWPDTLVWLPWWAGLVEFKGQKTLIKPIQLKVIWDLNRIRPWSALILRDAGDKRWAVNHSQRVVNSRGLVDYLEDSLETLLTDDQVLPWLRSLVEKEVDL